MQKNKTVFDSIKWTKRNKNLDRVYFLETPEYSIYWVFDWVSSSNNSIHAIEIATEFINNKHDLYYDWHFDVKALILNINSTIIKADISWAHSAVALIVKENNRLQIANLGDTRVYWIDKQFLKCLTVDHNDIINPNILTRYLWMKTLSLDDIYHIDIIDNFYRYIICSDWFYRHLEKNIVKLHEILNFKKIWQIKRSLLKLLENNNTDDATYILLNN